MKEFTGSSFYDTMCRLTRETGPLSVICHGDLWTPNLLFKYAANDIEAKVIDFQLARFASLATDISFFIYACTEQETREQHFEELIQVKLTIPSNKSKILFSIKSTMNLVNRSITVLP